ncbi:MAG: PAS domain S-box protein [Enhydrobacter sp.]|nr:PAS domain S-box protein [Enhydrobacter sp.]
MDSDRPELKVQFDLLIDAVVDYAIYMLDPDGFVLSWNTGAERLKGYGREEIIGQHFSLFYTQQDRGADLPVRALEKARTEGRFAAEGWRVRKDGSRFWASVVIDAIKDSSGNLIGFAKITRDFTERQEAQATLLASERRYRQLVEAVIDYAIFQLDVDGNIATWNKGAERAKGYSPDEAIGRHFSMFYTDEDRAAGLPQRALATAASEGRFETEGWRVRKDGSRFWAMVVIDPIYGDDGSLNGFAKVTRDITERQEAQRALRTAQEQLMASQKMEAVGQLSGGIAHDFNNLLMIVLGNIESATRQARQLPESTNLQRSLANAMRGAQRAAALTSRLLAFSRRQALDPKPIDPNRFLQGAVDFLQRSLGETVEIEAVGGAGIWTIEADPNQLESALVNLAINARDAMPSGGKLTLEAANIFADSDYVRLNPETTEGQYVAICVTDSGTGMAKDVVARAFEPFFTTKEAGHGTGLGLSQVYGFVKQSGGHVKIYSEVGQGTTVKMYFPRLARAQEEAEPIDEIRTAEAEESETVLLVEDDPDLRTYLGDMLRELKYRVVVAANAQAALHVLIDDNRRIDLLLTDVVMPGMNGRELGRRAEALRPGLSVLYMTGYSRNAVVHQGRLDEGVELVQKPVSQTELANRIREILDRPKKRRE